MLLLCLHAGCTTHPPTAAKLRRLQGYWTGELLGGSFKCSITIKGNSLYFYSRPDFWYKATFTLPAGTDPQQLRGTIKGTAASATNDTGKVIIAIFKIEHGTLTLAVNQDPAGPPPKAFPSETNTVIARYDLKKAQPQKKSGPTRNFVQSIFEDKDGQLWFGFSGGVFRFDGKSLVNFTRQSTNKP